MIFAYVLTSVVLVYIFIGYPLTIGFLAKPQKKTKQKGNGHLGVTAVIVACNEAQVIGEKLHNLLSLNYPASNLHIVVVDDASDDHTVAAAASVNDRRISVIRMLQRSGKAAGLNAAMKHVSSDLVFMLDCC